MYKKTAKTKRFIAFLLLFPLFILSSLQHKAFCGVHDESLGEIQWHVIENSNSNEKYAKSDKIILMGAFATSDVPTALPISLQYKYTTYTELYMGIVITNNSGSDKDVTVRFELSGPRSGEEQENITIPANNTSIAYIKDIFGRPGFYTFRGAIKDVGSAKIRLQLTDE